MARIIKGNWLEKDAEVRAAQSGIFIFINNNGSRWGGEEPGDIAELLEAMGTTPLDPDFENYGNFITQDPCVGVSNPDYRKVEGADEWIDGPRIFDVDGVVYFSGNFLCLSCAFSIYTNDIETIAKLTDAIRTNQQRDDYLSARVGRAA